MRWKQAILAGIVGTLIGCAVWMVRSDPAVVIGVGLGVYTLLRVIFATVGRIQYWYPRGTQGAHYKKCPNCNEKRYRVGGDWVLRCHQCGWKAGIPVIRWFTRSVPVNQLRRSISLTRIVSIIVAVMLIWVGMSGGAGIIDAVSNSDSSGEGGLNGTKVEMLVVEYTNQERANRGLEKLAYAPRIAEPARSHAQTMAEHDFIGHTAPNGETAQERYQEVCEYSGSGYRHGENAIGAWYEREFRAWKSDEMVYLSNESEVAHYLVNGWMRSEGHRENILTEGWREIGVGIHVRSDGKVFATQAFC